MDEIIIRKAVLEDLNILLRFEQGVINTEKPFDITLKEKPVYYDIVELITAPHIELVVAEYKNEIIGSGYARIETAKHYLRHQNHAYLGFMYVDPAHRGKGVNKKIIDTLEKWAAEKNIKELRLDVYNNNEPAIKAYEKVGFAKHMISMRKGIE
jgi:ribosomal protein S18 acetylase RimI-like enzyme